LALLQRTIAMRIAAICAAQRCKTPAKTLARHVHVISPGTAHNGVGGASNLFRAMASDS